MYEIHMKFMEAYRKCQVVLESFREFLETFQVLSSSFQARGSCFLVLYRGALAEHHKGRGTARRRVRPVEEVSERTKYLVKVVDLVLNKKKQIF